MAYVYFAIICLLFGSNFKLMDDATQVFGPLTIALARLAGGAVVLLAVVGATGQSLAVDRRTLGRIIFVALLSNAYPFAVQPWILSYGTNHSFLAIFVPLTPLLTIVAAVPMLGVRPTWQQSVGVLVGLAILVWVVLSTAASQNFDLWLVPIAVTVPLSYAIGNTFMRLRLQQVSSLVVSTLLLSVGATVLLPLAINEFASNPPQANVAQWVRAVLALAALGPLGTGACIGMFVRLVQQRGPLFAGMVTYVVPVVAFAWGVADGEEVHMSQLVGVAGILAMVALVQSSQANYATPRS